MEKLDLINVVSAGDEPTSVLRIEKALQLFYDYQAELFVLNGFNDKNKHDSEFKGETWRDDERLKNIYHDLEKIKLLVVYARNTVENGLELRKITYHLPYKLAETVTSETHLNRLKRIFFYVFPEEEFKDLSFSTAKDPSKNYIKRKIIESLEYPLTDIFLRGIKRGDWNIADIYNQKEIID